MPSQSATSVSVRHKLDPSSLPAGSRLVGTIHSHGAFSAFASATDEDDEADLDGLHVVVGDLLRRRPSFSAALVVDGHRFTARLSQVLERPGAIVPPPDEWLARVKVAPTPRRKPWKKHQPLKLLPGKIEHPVTSPDRRRLDELLDAAASLAEKLGYRLRTDLVHIRPRKERQMPSRFVLVGCGGIGSQLLAPLVRYLVHSSREALLVLVDGDVFEHGNALRQEFPASAVGR